MSERGNGMTQKKSESICIQVKLNSIDTLVLLDSGAQPSVLDYNFVLTQKIPFIIETSFVHGLASQPVDVCGTTDIQVDTGDGRIMTHRFCIIVSQEPTIILRRDFLERFEITTFDWQQQRVRLGSSQ